MGELPNLSELSTTFPSRDEIYRQPLRVFSRLPWVQERENQIIKPWGHDQVISVEPSTIFPEELEIVRLSKSLIGVDSSDNESVFPLCGRVPIGSARVSDRVGLYITPDRLHPNAIILGFGPNYDAHLRDILPLRSFVLFDGYLKDLQNAIVFPDRKGLNMQIHEEAKQLRQPAI